MQRRVVFETKRADFRQRDLAIRRLSFTSFLLNLNAYFGKPYLPALIADNHSRLLCGARGIFFIYLARGEGEKSMKLKNKIQTSSAVRTSGRCRPKKALIANNERVLFAVAELRLPELKDEGLLRGECETDYLSGL